VGLGPARLLTLAFARPTRQNPLRPCS
jgi:hypothetical protein